jgi:sodium transport system permease protein
MATYPCLALSTALGLRAASTEIERQRAPTRISVVVSGADAPALAARVLDVARKPPGGARADWPAAVAIESLPAADARARLEGGGCDLWVEADRGAEEQLDDAGTVVLPVHVPPGRPPSPRVREQFEAVMRAVADEARARRMARAGLPATVLRPVELKFVDLPGRPVPPPPRSITLELVGGVLVMLAVLTMTGAFYPAIDAIAGEKERGTIETLLIAPCSADVIVGGKFLAVFAVTLATLAVNVVSIAATAAVSMRLLPEGITMAVPGQGILSVGGAVLAFVGLAALAAATCLAVTTAAKSGKEAQNTLTPVILLVSGLAGTALLPGMRSDSWLAAVPFVGHVLVAREAFLTADAAVSEWLPAAPLLIVLVSSIAWSWLLLRATAAVLTDEDILFRGPDTTTRGFARPAARERPTVAQGIVPVIAGLAAVWYAQGFAPDDPLWAIPLQQAAIVMAPLAVMAVWQRVDWRRTFAVAPAGGGGLWRTSACVVGAALVGAGLFVIGAAALLAVRGTAMSDEARLLAEKFLELMQSRPWWVSWGLMAVLPAIGEELLFRGWVFAAFAGAAPARGRLAAAIIAQAACFAVVHLLPERMPQTFVLGIVLAVIVVRTGSLLPAIVGHLAHNSMPLVLMSLTGDATPAAAGPAIPARALAAAAAAVFIGGLLIAAGGRRPTGLATRITEEPWR